MKTFRMRRVTSEKYVKVSNNKTFSEFIKCKVNRFGKYIARKTKNFGLHVIVVSEFYCFVLIVFAIYSS